MIFQMLTIALEEHSTGSESGSFLSDETSSETSN